MASGRSNGIVQLGAKYDSTSFQSVNYFGCSWAYCSCDLGCVFLQQCITCSVFWFSITTVSICYHTINASQHARMVDWVVDDKHLKIIIYVIYKIQIVK